MPTPTWLWARSAGSAQNDYAGLDYGSSTISTDQAGNSYITGLFGGPATFGSITLTAPTYPRVFVAKYDTLGNCLWAKQFGGTNTDIYGNKGEAIDIDAAGNCYVTGTFHGPTGSIITVAPGVRLRGTGFRQIFVVKFDTNGTALWAKQPGGANSTNHYAKGISADFSGNSYITGYLGSNGVKFGTTPVLSGPGAYITKLDTNGNFKWAKKIGDSGNADGASVAVNIGNFTYITGYFQGTETFATPTPVTLTAIGNRDVFLAKVDANGVLLTVQQFGFADNYAYGRGVSTDMYGNVFLTGDFDKRIDFGGIGSVTTSMGNREAFVVKIDMNGVPLWAKQSTGSQEASGNSIIAAPNGECYVGGHYRGMGSVNFGSIPLLSNSARCTFVVKYDINGNVLWGQTSLNLNTGESPMGISYDANYNIYIAGNAQGAAEFGTNTLTAYGDLDAFIAKLSHVCP